MDVEVKSDAGGNTRLNNLVAITVVIFAVFMAVANVKGDNINQAMQKAKAELVDAWAEYQAARIKLHVDENGLATLRLMETSGQLDKALAAKQAAEYEADIKKYQERSKETRAKAEGLGGRVRAAQLPRRPVRPVASLSLDGDRARRHRDAGRALLAALRRLGHGRLRPLRGHCRFPRPPLPVGPPGGAAGNVSGRFPTTLAADDRCRLG